MDEETVAQLYARAAFTAWHGGDVAGGLFLCREGIAATTGQPESAGLAELLHETARECYFNGLPDEARPLVERALDIARKLDLVELQVHALATLGILPDQSYLGAIKILKQAVELGEAGSASLPASTALQRARNNLSIQLSEAGDFRPARRQQQLILEAARQADTLLGEMYALTQLAFYDLILGDLPAVEELIQEMYQAWGEARSGTVEVYIQSAEAWLLRCRGELAEAVRRWETAQALIRQGGDLQSLAATNFLLPETFLEMDEAAAVKAY